PVRGLPARRREVLAVGDRARRHHPVPGPHLTRCRGGPAEPDRGPVRGLPPGPRPPPERPAMSEPTAKIRLGREFNLLWTGQSVSLIGDKINLFVVPTVMILLLHASPFQVGLVAMAQYLAIPV